MRYFIALVFCVFLGMTGISLGLGAAVPSINLVAKPFVCPDGAMEATRSSRKGTGRNRNATYTSANWTCEDSKGDAKPISSLTIALIAGPFYGVLMFLPVALLMAVAKRGRAARASQGMPGPGFGPGPGQGPPRGF